MAYFSHLSSVFQAVPRAWILSPHCRGADLWIMWGSLFKGYDDNGSVDSFLRQIARKYTSGGVGEVCSARPLTVEFEIRLLLAATGFFQMSATHVSHYVAM